MKRTLLLTSAAVALTLGLTPALAQDQDHTNSKLKRDQAATEQHNRDANRHSQKAKSERGAKETAPASDTSSSRKAANKDETGSRNTTGQADNNKAGTKPSGTDAANSKSTAPKSAADSDSKTSEPKRAEDRNQKPADAAATNKSTNEPSKNAEQNSTRSPAAQKSTQTNEPNRNAASQAPSRNAADTKSGSKESVAAKLDPQKKSQLTAAIDKVSVKPLTHVDFSVSVGVAVPRTVELRPVPTTIVEIVPQYRGYDFFVVRDEVVIVEPRTHKIVDVIERGPTRARAETTTRRVKLSAHQREIIRHHATKRRTVTTTGTAPRTTTEVTVGETLPESVEVESFPEEVYREVPEVREYRYIERGDDLYLVDPSSRRVIEEVR